MFGASGCSRLEQSREVNHYTPDSSDASDVSLRKQNEAGQSIAEPEECI